MKANFWDCQNQDFREKQDLNNYYILKIGKNHLKSSMSFEFITLYQWKTLDPKIVVFDSKGYHTMEYISAMESDNCVALKYLEIHPKPWDIEY